LFKRRALEYKKLLINTISLNYKTNNEKESYGKNMQDNTSALSLLNDFETFENEIDNLMVPSTAV
jgi:hypothetical protein